MTIERGIVVQVREDGLMVQIPSRGPSYVFGPMDRPDYPIAVNDRVLVGSVGYVADDFDVLTKIVDAGPRTGYFIYTFANTADRDVVFDGVPAHMISPTFAWVEDIKKLFVWTTVDDSWHQVSWDEVRVASIESTVSGNSASITAINSAITTINGNITTINTTLTTNNTRLTNLEAFDVGNTTAIQLNLTTVSGHKHLEAQFLANTVPLNDLSDVIVSAPVVKQTLRHNGTNWVNAQLATSDLSDVDLAGLADTYMLAWDAASSKWTVQPRGPLGYLGTNIWTGGAAISAGVTTSEVAMPAWDTGKDTAFTFKNNRLYEAKLRIGVYNGAAASSTVERIGINLRKAVNSTTAQILGSILLPTSGAGAVMQYDLTFPIINVSGADITGVHIGLTSIRGTGSNTQFMYGDSVNGHPLALSLVDMGPTTNIGNLTSFAVSIT